MPKADWDGTPKYGDFEPIPANAYKVKVTKVTKKISERTEREFWNLELTIQEGDYEGRKVWDSLFFESDTPEKTKSVIQRVMLVAHRLGGVELSGDFDFDPETLLGKIWTVDIIKKIRNGKEQNAIPFDGYHKRDDDTVPEVTDDSDLPF